MCTLFRQVSSASGFDSRPTWRPELPFVCWQRSSSRAWSWLPESKHNAPTQSTSGYIFLRCCSGYIRTIPNLWRLLPQSYQFKTPTAPPSIIRWRFLWCIMFTLPCCVRKLMNQPASGDQSGSDSAAMVEFLHQENELSSGRPFANHHGKNQPARLQGPERNSKLSAVVLVLRRQHSEFEGEFLVPEPSWAGFLVIFPKSSSRLLPSSGCNWRTVGCCGPLLCGELNIVEQNHVLSRWELFMMFMPLEIMRIIEKLWVLFCVCLVACKEYWNSDSHSF